MIGVTHNRLRFAAGRKSGDKNLETKRRMLGAYPVG